MESTAQLEQQAISAAMKGAWDLAIEINQKILKLDPENITALNRLAKAFWEKSDLDKAKQTFKKVLALDPYNVIANKNLQRLADQKKAKVKTPGPANHSQRVSFLEEPGRTKVVKLIHLAATEILSQANNGDEVFLSPKERSISVTNDRKVYLGRVPDDLSHRLLALIKGGNEYQVFVKAADRQNLEVFIQETKRAPRLRNQPSFTAR